MHFDLDSANLYLDSCIIARLNGFRSHFIKGSYQDIPERSTDTTIGKATIIIEGIATYCFNNNSREPYALYIKIAYTPQYMY